MSQRIKINSLEPAAYEAMLKLESYGQTCQLTPIQKELIKMRASQINGCAYCLDMHTEDALKYGETQRRIFALPVWYESHLFSEEERALLQITEEVTNISEKGVTDATYKKAIELFGENKTAQIIMLIITINSWNRIAVSTRLIYKP
ncbi:MAG: carboxymuconolactone decarboxylase family protein [Flavobacteriales bacterium]|nr:carboxymuconolactone decarboxylase family protein [Flavobacteriales bacterium]